ncbi:ABC transporter permease subunit [Herbiconiux daphne]|uniref:ABC transporter permease subunit n=1 Tax=Herbiconiux daphne TaxID=2970914 RepID=A0ABT2GW68_9MICO|nr:ABC transporter permease subunit [Herbiconiux daphne]MCS5732204.1 ABC transporter permease subunit [Herbiconiux daphne]
MTAAVVPAPSRASFEQPSAVRLRFSGILASEWIKLTTLRSTVWAYAIVVVVQIGMGVVLVLTQGDLDAPGQAANQLAVLPSTLGILLNQLVISVLGVLVISGEYGTGQIRSSLTAVPRRTPVLVAKAIVFSVTTFVVGLVSVFAAYAVTWPLLEARGVASDLSDPDLWGRLVGGAGYLALVGLMALFLGAVLRHTAGGIAAALGLLLVLPSVLSFIDADWVRVLVDWLPGNVGQTLFLGSSTFEPWQAVLVMLGWIAVFATAAVVLLKRRDA